MSEFWLHAEREVELLYRELVAGTYSHGPYEHFVVCDTKRRDIFVARVRDRIVHQIVSDRLQKIYGRKFYTYSCAAQKGKGVRVARAFVFDAMRHLRCRSRVWYAHLDVRHYFSSVDHEILLRLLARHVKVLWLFNICKKIISSFGVGGRGLPLGNLSSQWFANIYLHEMDWFVKHELHVRNYMRYNDDIIIVGTDEVEIRRAVGRIQAFARDTLRLDIPECKTVIGCLPKSLDVLGMCTNGDALWVRQNTVRKAQERITELVAVGDPKLLDVLCSYSSIINVDILCAVDP